MGLEFKASQAADSYGNFTIIRSDESVQSPAVSVIMSVYNNESFLDISVNSILEQTFKDFEFIIINDGSTDKSLDLLKNFQERDSRIVIVDQKNMGLTRSLNRCIDLARGYFLARQDADDYSFSQRLEVMYKAARESHCDFMLAQARTGAKVFPMELLLRFNNVNTLKAGNIFAHGTFFGKRQIFQKIKYDIEFIYTQDFKFLLDLIQTESTIGVVKKVLYKSLDNHNNISNTKYDEQHALALRALIKTYGKLNFLHRIIYSRQPSLVRMSVKLLKISCVIIPVSSYP